MAARLLIGFGGKTRRIHPEYVTKVWGIPKPLALKLREESEAQGMAESELVRAILFQYFTRAMK